MLRKQLLCLLMSLVIMNPALALASPDAAIVAGDLKVDGIHFSADGSVITRLSDAIGPQGPEGANGYNSLITMVNEPVGSNCAYGGVKVQTGLDSNRNGSLDSGEITQTKYVCNNGQIIVNGGSVVGTTASNVNVATTWTANNIYIVNSSITVSAALTIQPGTIIKFGANAYINVTSTGSINATGTAAQPITFTSLKDDLGADSNGDGGSSSPAAGDWRGITISGTGSNFAYCRFYYGGSGNYSTLVFDDQVARVDHCTFSHNGVTNNINAAPALDARTALAGSYVTSCTFSNNYVPVGINVTFNMNDTNAFSGNRYQGIVVDGCSTVMSNIVWSAKTVPYVIGDSNGCNYVDVHSASSITLADGAVLKFFPNGSLNVDGSLIANGTNGIVFTSIRDDAHGGDTNYDGASSAAQRGDWGYIKVSGSGSLFNKASFLYAGGTTNPKPALEINNTSVTVTNSTFAHNGIEDDINADPALDAREATAGTVITGNTFFDDFIPLGISTAFGLDDSNTFTVASTTPSKYNGIKIKGCSIYVSNISLTATKAPFIVGDSSGCNYVNIDDTPVTVGSGTIFKFFSQGSIQFSGTGSMPNVANAFFTSIKDDARGGDTNGDGSTTTPANGDWWGMHFVSLPNGADSFWIPQADHPQPTYMFYPYMH